MASITVIIYSTLFLAYFLLAGCFAAAGWKLRYVFVHKGNISFLYWIVFLWVFCVLLAWLFHATCQYILITSLGTTLCLALVTWLGVLLTDRFQASWIDYAAVVLGSTAATFFWIISTIMESEDSYTLGKAIGEISEYFLIVGCFAIFGFALRYVLIQRRTNTFSILIGLMWIFFGVLAWTLEGADFLRHPLVYIVVSSLATVCMGFLVWLGVRRAAATQSLWLSYAAIPMATIVATLVWVNKVWFLPFAVV